MGTRERLLDVARRYPDRLRTELHALATHVLFDAGNRAVGVEYLKGQRLYRAHRQPSASEGEPRTVRAAREVILAGGAFNTPQLLMLSGIGPRAVLEQHGIKVRVDMPGVGRNLQDRYEIGVVNRMSQPWSVLNGARFAKDDRLFGEWLRDRTGMYVSNGAALAVSLRSQAHRRVPDLFCMALLARFQWILPRIFARHRGASRLSHLGRSQGTHEQSCWRGHAALVRSARYATGQLPLLRGGHRCDGRGPAGCRNRIALCPHDDSEIEAVWDDR